jgi:hypothetical protein
MHYSQSGMQVSRDVDAQGLASRATQLVLGTKYDAYKVDDAYQGPSQQ